VTKAEAIWCAAYGAAYANAVAARQRRGDDPLPDQDETPDLMTVGDCAVEAWKIQQGLDAQERGAEARKG
jgi:hypothetical protein